MDNKIVLILNEMSEYLSVPQMKKLADNEPDKVEISNTEFLDLFLDAKKVEGCSERTITYYKVTIEHLLKNIDKSVRKITTEEIRSYLSEYQKKSFKFLFMA